MFARILTCNLKVGDGPAYAMTVDREVMPILRRFAGFRDQITLISSDGKHAIGLTFWEEQEDAETYARIAYQDVMKCLQDHIEGAPEIRTYTVTNSTLHAIVAREAGA